MCIVNLFSSLASVTEGPILIQEKSRWLCLQLYDKEVVHMTVWHLKIMFYSVSLLLKCQLEFLKKVGVDMYMCVRVYMYL